MKNHLGRDDDSRKTLCGIPAGFRMTLSAEQEKGFLSNLCGKCASIQEKLEA